MNILFLFFLLSSIFAIPESELHMYVYDSIEKIKKDAESAYIDFLFDIILNTKEAYFPAKSKGKLYLVVKDVNNDLDVEYLKMFNENDQRTLTEESSVVINRFHKAKTYTLTARVGQAKGKISIVNMVKDKLDHIVIKKEEQVLVDTTDDVEDVEFNEAIVITMTTTKVS